MQEKLRKDFVWVLLAISLSGLGCGSRAVTARDTTIQDVNATDKGNGLDLIPADLDATKQDERPFTTDNLDIGGEDLAMPQPDPCANVTCSNHGQCKVLDDRVFCWCDKGYKSEGLKCIRIQQGKTKILFDRGHGVDSGNADWVIDDDYPRPDPSNPSSEEDWSGAISRWAFELYRTGDYEIYNTGRHFKITYGQSADLDLSNFDIFVSCEPNKPFTMDEKKALVEFVKNGGRFILVIDHRHSDRDHDGWDSPSIANDLFTNNGVQSNPFGITIPKYDGDFGNNISGKYRHVNTKSPVINGPFGMVTQVNFHNGTNFTINQGVIPLVWKDYSNSSESVVAAVVKWQKGWFALLGDSSPVDDGTGAHYKKLYDGWDEADDGKFILNLTAFMRTQ